MTKAKILWLYHKDKMTSAEWGKDNLLVQF